MFDEGSFSIEAFSTESFLFDISAVVSLGAGSGSKPKRKRRFVEEDGNILVFETAEEAQLYLDIKYAEKASHKAVKRKQTPKPVKVVEVEKVVELANAYSDYQYSAKVYAATLDEDYARLVAIWNKLIEIEDEEIIVLL